MIEHKRAFAADEAARRAGVRSEYLAHLVQLGIVLPAAVWTSLTPGRVPVYTSTYAEAYRHAALLDTIEQLQAVVDSCLVEKGYHRFRLTAAQMRVLRTLPHGSAERERYLHGLGANAQVLSTQGV